MLSCDVVTDLMAVYESGEASAETRRLVEEHLASCPACRSAFDKGARVESALTGVKATRDEKPSNGQRFVSKTRRLFFFVGAGVLVFFAIQAAVVMRIAAREVAGMSLGRFPGLPGLALTVTAGMALAYIILVLWRTPSPRGPRTGDITRAVAGGILLTVLALLTFYLWVAGPVLGGVIAFLFLLAALTVTVARLPRLPYFTIVTMVSLLVAIVVLLNGVLIGRMFGGRADGSNWRPTRKVVLAVPADSVGADEAVRVDLAALGLSLVESQPVSSVDHVAIGTGARAAAALYRGAGNEATVTVVRLSNPVAASEFYREWKSSTLPRIRVMHFENNLSGADGWPEHSMKTYDRNGKRAYVVWQAGDCVTIIAVPGPMKEARTLAREIEEFDFESFMSGRG